MELHFATPNLEAIANSPSQLNMLFGAYADRARQRLCELAASEHLAEAASLPTLCLMPSLQPDGYRVRVSDIHHIVFEPVNGVPKGRGAAKKAAHNTITSIRILSLGRSNDR